MSDRSSHEKQRNVIQICHSHSRVVPAAKLVLKTHIAIKALEFMTTGYSFTVQFISSTVPHPVLQAAQVTPPPPQEAILL